MNTKWKVILPTLLLIFCTGTALADELLMLKGGYQLLSPSGSLGGTTTGLGQSGCGERLES